MMVPEHVDDVRRLRGQPRRKLFQPVELHAGAGAIRAHLLDLSATGALVHSAAAPIAGSPVRLTIGGAVRAARVVWQDGVRFGIAFAIPLRDMEVERLLAPPFSAGARSA